MMSTAAPRYVRYELWSAASLEGTIALGGARVLVELGGERVVQELESDDAAREHVQRLLRSRKSDGVDRIVEVTMDAAEFGVLSRPLPESLVLDRRKGMAFFRTQPDADAVSEMVRFAPRVVRVGCSMGCAPFSPLFRDVTIPSVETFIFHGGLSQDQLGRNNASGDLASVFTSMANLRRAFCSGKLAMSATKHPSLEELYLLGNPIDPALIDALARSSWPSLGRLAIGLGCDERAEHVALPAALSRLDAPKLKHVELEVFDDVIGFLDHLYKTDLPPSWTELTIRNTTLGVLDVEETGNPGHRRVTVANVSTAEPRAASAQRWLEMLRKHRPSLARLSRLRLPIAGLPRATRTAAKELVSSLVPDAFPPLGDMAGFLVDWEYGKPGRRKTK